MELTERETEVLEIIRENPMVSREKIANKLKISSSAIGTYIHSLMSKGYLLGRGYILAPKKKVVVVGGCNIDLKAYAKDKYITESSNQGFLVESLGGVGRNIAENLGVLGQETVLLSTVGQDNYGNKIIKQTAKPNLNLDYTIRSSNYRTGTYLAHFNAKGELIGAIADMEILKTIDSNYLYKHRQIVKQAAILVVDTNLTEDAIQYLFDLVSEKDIPVVVEPVSVSKSRKISDKLDQIDILTPNLDEAIDLLGLKECDQEEMKDNFSLLTTAYERQKLNLTLVISLGAKGVFILNSELAEFIPADSIEQEKIVETTGAGDALTAGLIYGLIKGQKIRQAVELGLKAARLTIMSSRSVNLELQKSLLIEEEGIN